MYYWFVRQKILGLFASINRRNAGPLLVAFAPKFEHVFLGNHALGGSRTTLAATREWYDRLLRLLPDIHFDVRRIWVSGPPWNTVAVIEWDESNSGTDGVRTANSGIHALHLRWGRVTRLIICPDTIPLKATLDRLALAGVGEAAAPPITDSYEGPPESNRKPADNTRIV